MTLESGSAEGGRRAVRAAIAARGSRAHRQLLRQDSASVRSSRAIVTSSCASSDSDIQYGNPTFLWDAIDRSLDALASETGRRVVLAFTDGDDTGSRTTNFRNVVNRAVNEDFMVYAIGLQSEIPAAHIGVTTRPDRRLRELLGADRRRIFRADSHRRSQLHLQSRGRRAASPVRHRLRAREARRSRAQARGAGQGAGNERACAQELSRDRYDARRRRAGAGSARGGR